MLKRRMPDAEGISSEREEASASAGDWMERSEREISSSTSLLSMIVRVRIPVELR